ncbi:MAG: hypothetical protein ABFD89_18530 [Bryobacteraceae bacterium]
MMSEGPPTDEDFQRINGRFIASALFAFLVAATLILIAAAALAHDSGQWEATDPQLREWYQSLMQPDAPTASCCGEADAYWCDDIHVREGKTFCKITDDRPDEPRGRPHRDVGEEFEIPPNKLKWDRGNPTGHAVIFLGRSDYVFCFVHGGGA